MIVYQLLKSKVFLILICILFLFTRLYKISEIPVSVYWDEASIAYNAYSITQIGKDEWGEVYPLHFRGFGEFKLPVYIYATAVSTKLFGLNEFAVRFPAVLFSLGVVILTYILAKKLTEKDSIGLFSSFFVCISPWFFIFSRSGYEATAGLCFYLLAISFFLDIRKNAWNFLFSIFSFILSVYSYNSFRITVPLTILILLIYEILGRKITLRKILLPILISLVITAASMIPIYRLYKYDSGGNRLQTVKAESSNYLGNYLSHLSPQFLLMGDKNLRSQQSNFGQVYLPELILIVIGLFYILYKKKAAIFLIMFLFLLGPIPAAITKESPHALRTISVVPFLAIISALGLEGIGNFIKRGMLVNLILTIILLVLFGNYFLSFIKNYPSHSSRDWQYGYKVIFTNYNNQFDRFDKILISDSYAQPYIFALYYLNYDPKKFISEVKYTPISNWGFSTVASFNKFEFRKITKDDLSSKKTLIFASPADKIGSQKSNSEIKFLDGETAFWVYNLE